MMPTLRSCRILAVVATFVCFAPAALAGPPLICHPFVVDSASPLLPWAAGREWRLPHPDYDVASLTADTLALLSVDAPISRGWRTCAARRSTRTRIRPLPKRCSRPCWRA